MTLPRDFGTVANAIGWRPQQGRIASVRTWLFAGVHASESWTVEVNGRIHTIVGGASGTATCTAIYNALRVMTPQTNPEIFRYTWTDSGAGTLTATQKTNNDTGRVDTITIARVSGAGTVDGVASSTGVVVTAADSPNHLSTRNLNGTALADGKVLIFEDSDIDLKWNLSQSAITLLGLIVRMSFTGEIGLPKLNDKGSHEGQERYLKCGAVADGIVTYAVIGTGEGEGPPLVMFNTVDSQAVWDIQNTGTPRDDTEYACYLLGTHASNALYMGGGRVAVAAYPGEASTLLTVDFNQNPLLPRGKLLLGAGCTMTNATIKNTGGDIESHSLFLDGVLDRGGIWTHYSGNVDDLTIFDGTWFMRSGDTINNLFVGHKGVYDCRGSNIPRTANSITLMAGAKYIDPNDTTSRPAGIELLGCTPNEVTIVVGKNQVVSFS